MSGKNPARRIAVEFHVVCVAEGVEEGVDDFFKPGTIGQKEIISTFVLSENTTILHHMPKLLPIRKYRSLAVKNSSTLHTKD